MVSSKQEWMQKSHKSERVRLPNLWCICYPRLDPPGDKFPSPHLVCGICPVFARHDNWIASQKPPQRILITCTVLCVLSFCCVIWLKSNYISARCVSSQASVDPPPGAILEVPLAQTGEGISECELLKWFVQEVSRLFFFFPHVMPVSLWVY